MATEPAVRRVPERPAGGAPVLAGGHVGADGAVFTPAGGSYHRRGHRGPGEETKELPVRFCHPQE